jgi:hypothetical protein
MHHSSNAYILDDPDQPMAKQMKLTLKIMMTAGSLLLLSSLAGQAQTVYEDHSETRYSDGSKSSSSSRTVIRDYDAERRQALAEQQQALAEDREIARQQAEHARLAAEEKARAEQRFQAAIDAQNARHDQQQGRLQEQAYAQEKTQVRDDDQKIAAYIKANGYDVSQDNINKLRAYMFAHGLLHVEQIGQ